MRINQKHTGFTMRAELKAAQDNGNLSECRDLEDLIRHCEHRPLVETASYVRAIKAARNRQGARRHQRRGAPDTLGPGTRCTSHGAPGKTLIVDRVTRRGSATFLETHVDGTGFSVNGPLKYFAIVGAVDANALLRACDALYHAVVDAIDANALAGLEGAATAYEAAVAAAGYE